jgi:imidazoleglycerol-phosphate dehydratase / histidinol-phosphatase
MLDNQKVNSSLIAHNSSLPKILFLDRDGCILVEPQPDQQIDDFRKFAFVPGAIFGLARLARETDFEMVLVTNQDGLGTDSFLEDTFWPCQNMMMQILENEGVRFRSVHIDRSFRHQNLPTRKPGTAMLTDYLGGEFDLANSYVIGDRLTDLQLAQNLGARGILLRNDSGMATDSAEYDPTAANVPCELVADSWEQVVQHLRTPPRRVQHRRTTRETDIRIDLCLDGSGQSRIATGLGFLDHMLDQVARHGLCDLAVTVQGDLHIDEHHTVEDTALALGTAFDLAIGDKRGMERYGFCLPMDDAEAHVSLDFGGRPWLVWEVEFRRERIGDVPTEMWFHFFKSFSDQARCNLNIRCTGQNEHHKIEAIFKAFARAIRMAVRRDPLSRALPSTKGVL